MKKVLNLILTASFIIFIGCVKKAEEENKQTTVYPEFKNEVQVTINGYNLDAMEPFISKDGNYLFFNSLNDSVNTSLYYTSKVNDTTFEFKGELFGANGTAPHLDAVASMDINNNFYFVSTRNYPQVFENYQTGKFNNGSLTNLDTVKGDIYINTLGWIVMDWEISGNGNTLYYVNSYFKNNILSESKLGIAEKSNSSFTKSVLSDKLLININNSNFLIYAPSISSDGKELYFTRTNKEKNVPEICVSIKNNTTDLFSPPKIIKISGNMIEAPSLTSDGERLYYHKKSDLDGKYHIYSLTRE